MLQHEEKILLVDVTFLSLNYHNNAMALSPEDFPFSFAKRNVRKICYFLRCNFKSKQHVM